jgi:hypothetical protein
MKKQHRSFCVFFLISALAFSGFCAVFIVFMDPYGLRVRTYQPARPLMDLNQRFMYPQIVRSEAYNSGVFGTSTLRLLNPERLNSLFETRFANLAMNASTPWEQVQIMNLFLRTNAPSLRWMLIGLDTPWCEENADMPEKKLTFRAFPPWLYDAKPQWFHAAYTLNFKSLEIAGRVFMFRLKKMPFRIRGDGYEVFTPPEHLYDLAQARKNLWGENFPQNHTLSASSTTTVTLSPAEKEQLRFPALVWLEDILKNRPSQLKVLLVFPPAHITHQPQAGSLAAAKELACKARAAQLAQQYGAYFADFRRATPLTQNDENYWDPLHYRLHVAQMLAVELHNAAQKDPPSSVFYQRTAE